MTREPRKNLLLNLVLLSEKVLLKVAYNLTARETRQ